jgi:hypothetical protein
MTPAAMLASAVADGVRVTASRSGLHLSGERRAVQRWAGPIRSRRTEVLELAKVSELCDLLDALLWDAPYEVEPEIERALRNGALEEALPCYRFCYEECERLGELKVAPNDSPAIYWGVW